MKELTKRIFILDGISSQGLPLMRSFSKSGHQVTILSPHKINAGFFSRYANKKLVFAHLYDDQDATYNWLLEYLGKNPTDLVLGLGDKTAKILSKHQDEIKTHTNLIVPDFAVFSIASDKLKTMQFCMENQIPCPFTIDAEVSNIEHHISKIRFPVIVKPKVGVGSIGVFKYSDPVAFINDFSSLRKQFGPMLIQEFIPNESQYTVEVFCDARSNVKTCVIIEKARFYPVSGGTSSCNKTVFFPEIEKIITTFLEKLGWVGSANLDVIFDKRDNTPKIIEINPRVGAMVRIVFEAGVDIAEMSMQLAFSNLVDEKKIYREGIVLRNLMLEFLWLFSSPVKAWFKSTPPFFSFFGKNIYLQNVRPDDPFTGIGLLLGNVRKYLKPENFRKKLSSKPKALKC